MPRLFRNTPGVIIPRPHPRTGFPQPAGPRQKLGLEDRARHGGNFASRLHQGNGARPEQIERNLKLLRAGARGKSGGRESRDESRPGACPLGRPGRRRGKISRGVSNDVRAAGRPKSCRSCARCCSRSSPASFTKSATHAEVVEVLNSPLARQGGLDGVAASGFGPGAI